MPESQPSKPGPVAVIAVHGVADQQPNCTAVRAANLLLLLGQVNREGNDRSGPKPEYAGFEQEDIRVGVEPLNVSGMEEEDAWQYQLRRHLEHYKGEGTESYATVRMEGYRVTKERAEDEPKVDRPVHVYEMYWADASRLPIGILNLFLGIYRLLFQTSWLGVQTIGKWSSFAKDVGRWSKVTSFRGVMLLLNHVTSMILTRFMPLLYLFMIGLLLLMVIPVVENPGVQKVLGGLGGYPGLFALDVVIVVTAVLIALAAKMWRLVPWPPLYVVVALVSFLAWNVAFALFQDQAGSWRAEAGVAVATWGVICLIIGLFILPGLGKRFPGAGVVGLALMGYFTLFLFVGLTDESEWPVLLSGPILALRMGFALLPFAWIILATSANLFLILAAVQSISFWFRRGLDREVLRRKRARLRTAAISIVLPVLFISFLNSTFFLLALVPFKLGLVDGALPVAGRMADAPAWVRQVGTLTDDFVEPFAKKWASMPDFEIWTKRQAAVSAQAAAATQGAPNSSAGVNSQPGAASADATRQVPFSDFAKYASKRMVVPFLEAVFLIVLLVLGYSLWVVAPAALAERSFRNAQRSGKTLVLSQALGNNLTQGYRWLWSGQVVLAGCLLATQAMFGYRGVRTKELLATDPNYQHQGGVMTLVDQFLGIRHLGEEAESMPGPAVAVAAPTGGTTLSASPSNPASAGQPAPIAGQPSPLAVVEPVVALAPAPSPGTGSSPVVAPSRIPSRPATQPAPGSVTPTIRPPGAVPGSGAVRTTGQPSGSSMRGQVPRAWPARSSSPGGSQGSQHWSRRYFPRPDLPVPQAAFEQRQEVRDNIEGIFKNREIAQLTEAPPASAGGTRAVVAAKKEEETSPGLFIRTVTEAVLFLNSGPLTSALGAVILLLGIGYVFFARLVDPIMAGLRGGLDIALDVLNYLRPRPVDEVPRAKILSRYASLLRFITNWRDPANPNVGYSRIVIVAHSQGTVITSDMLRMLNLGSVAGDNDLHLLRTRPDSTEGIPIRLVTMGSPLRQLYAARFPDLYAWDSNADPRLTHRGLESWWNVYRSGDYVGRMLFRDEKDPNRFVPGHDFVLKKDGKNLPVRETCLGPGAHIHYWDETAPRVIRALDQLIACDNAADLCALPQEKRTGGT